VKARFSIQAETGFFCFVVPPIYRLLAGRVTNSAKASLVLAPDGLRNVTCAKGKTQMENQHKKIFVKVDPNDPLPALEFLWEKLTGKPLTAQERSELDAELAPEQHSQDERRHFSIQPSQIPAVKV
jgi:hypothetical protein